MSELFPSDATLNALAGTSEPRQEVPYLTPGQSPYHVSFFRMQHRLLEVALRAGDLRVFKDGPLTFGVRAGRVMDGGSVHVFGGAAGVALADNAVSAIWLAADGTLAHGIGGFPDASQTPHVPLAIVSTGTQSAAGASGEYAIDDILDCRGGAFIKPATSLSAARANRAAAFFAAGDATRLVLRGATTGASPVELTSDGAGATAGNTFGLAPATAYALRVRIVGRQSTGAKHAMFVRQALAARSAGGSAMVDTPEAVGTDVTDGTAWSVALSVDAGQHRVKVEATGGAGATVDWVAVIDAAAVA